MFKEFFKYYHKVSFTKFITHLKKLLTIFKNFYELLKQFSLMNVFIKIKQQKGSICDMIHHCSFMNDSHAMRDLVLRHTSYKI